METFFATEPLPHHEAVNLIAGKPAVSRAIFDDMRDEFKGRAFTITGVEAFDVMQAVRDEIAKLPAGADWKKLRKEIAADISPWLGEEEGKRRAELLLIHHGTNAYDAMDARLVYEQRDVFTHRMYVSSRTSKEPRDSHKALDGLMLPTDHPFWETHSGSWEFGCKCGPHLALTQEDAEDAEREKPGSVATPGQLAALEQGTLSRGPSQNFDIRTPRQKNGSGYEFNWRDTTLPYEEIRKRWTPDVAEKFEAWAGAQEVLPGSSLLEWILPSAAARAGAPPTLGAMLAAAPPKSITPDAMAALLRAGPEHPVSQAVKLWGDDEKTFTRMMEGKTPQAIEWKTTMEAALRKMAPVEGEPVLYRGWSFKTAQEMEEFMAKWPDSFIQERVGMSASFDPAVAARDKFSGGPHSMIWVIEGNRSARDMRDLFRETDAKAHREREEESIIPAGGIFRFASKEATLEDWKDSDGQTRNMRVFYLQEETI